jgi:hypothetical protein
MKGLQLLLQSFGIKIQPEEIESAWNASKDALPKLAAHFDEISATQKRIEQKLDALLAGKAIDNGRDDIRPTVGTVTNGRANN